MRATRSLSSLVTVTWAVVLTASFALPWPATASEAPAPLAAAQATATPPAPTRTPDVIFVPTPEEVVDAMLKVAKVSKNDVVYDLGCGDGRIVIAAAQKLGARGVGIDIDPQRIKEATANAQKAGVTDRVQFRNADLFTSDISEATVVTLYLLPSLNVKLRPKLLKELRPGTRIVSHAFDMGDWMPEQTVEVNGRRVFFWTVPKPGAGE
jgi:precorrin-6B methylase 2